MRTLEVMLWGAKKKWGPLIYVQVLDLFDVKLTSDMT